MELNNNDFLTGSLRVMSFVRPAKLFTAHESIFVAEAGKLKPEAINRVIEAVKDVITGS